MPACLCMSYGLVYPAGGPTDVMYSYVLCIAEIVPTDHPTTKSPAAAAAETSSTESDLQKSTPQTTPAKGNHLHIHRRILVICV